MVKKPVKKRMSTRAKTALSFVLIGIVSLFSIYYALGAYSNWSEEISEKSLVKEMLDKMEKTKAETITTTTIEEDEEINMCDVIRLTFKYEKIKWYFEDGKYCYYTEDKYIPILLEVTSNSSKTFQSAFT